MRKKTNINNLNASVSKSDYRHMRSLKEIMKLLYKFLFVIEFKVSSLVMYIGNEKNSFFVGFIKKRIAKKLLLRYHVIVSPEAHIGKNTFLPHPINIVIGKGVIIGNNCRIYHEVTLGQNRDKYPSIENNVIIYPGAKIIGDIRIGDSAVIGSNTVVTKNVPDKAIVAGVPAKILGYRSEEDVFY